VKIKQTAHDAINDKCHLDVICTGTLIADDYVKAHCVLFGFFIGSSDVSIHIFNLLYAMTMKRPK
jgi:hypothetical protein